LKPYGGLLEPNADAETALRDGARLYWSEYKADRNELPTFGAGPEFPAIILKGKAKVPEGCLQITATYAATVAKDVLAAYPKHVIEALKQVKKDESTYYSNRMGRIRARFTQLTHQAAKAMAIGSGTVEIEPGEKAPEGDTRQGPSLWKDYATKTLAEMCKRAINSRTKRHDVSAPTPGDFKVAEAAFWKALTK
jgi:hypothetical protein